MEKLKIEERELIATLSERLSVEKKKAVLADLEILKIKECAPNRAWIIFEIPGYERPIYHGQHMFEVEGTLRDKDGSNVSALLYGDENDRILELEFVRWDAQNIIDLQWDTLEISG